MLCQTIRQFVQTSEWDKLRTIKHSFLSRIMFVFTPSNYYLDPFQHQRLVLGEAMWGVGCNCRVQGPNRVV